MEKQNITMYTENELSLQIFNDECLYKMRRQILRNPSLLDDIFIYTNEQLKIALNDLTEDLGEF